MLLMLQAVQIVGSETFSMLLSYGFLHQVVSPEHLLAPNLHFKRCAVVGCVW